MMPVPVDPAISFDDQEAVSSLIIRSFEIAVRKAAAENDSLGIPTPVGMNGKVVYFLGSPSPGPDPKITIKEQKTAGISGNDRRPWMWIVAGPNGSGKTTFTREFLANLCRKDFVSLNADDLTKELIPNSPDRSLAEVNLMAAQQIDAKVTSCIRSDQSFLVETALSTDKYQDDVLEAKSRGFGIFLVFISVYPPELSPARVNLRTLKGGHSVDPEKALARYRKSHDQAIWFGAQADAFMFFDNSGRPSAQ